MNGLSERELDQGLGYVSQKQLETSRLLAYRDTDPSRLELQVEKKFTSAIPVIPERHTPAERVLIPASRTDYLGFTKSEKFLDVTTYVSFCLAEGLPGHLAVVSRRGANKKNWLLNVKKIANFYLDPERLSRYSAIQRREVEYHLYRLVHSSDCTLGKIL